MLCTNMGGAAAVAQVLPDAVEDVGMGVENTLPTAEPLPETVLPDGGTSGGQDFPPEEAQPEEGVPLPEETAGPEEETPLPQETAGPEELPEEPAAVYTLHLTHYFRFTVNGEGRNVRAEETLELTEADFVDGFCDLNLFACGAEQLTVTKADPLPLEAFGETREGGAQIVYALNSGWRIVPAGQAGGEGSVLRDVFQGQLSDYEFVPANVVRMNVEYKYSSTGGLAGIDAADPQVVEALPIQNADGTYEFEFALPTAEGFRIVLNPAPLNEYLVKAPTGNETQEELQEMLQNGSFSGDIANKCIYYYQEYANDNLAEPDYTKTNPQYNNRYSTEYNLAWNQARIFADENYTAAAICGTEHTDDEDHGANPLSNPRLKVTLNETQLQNALENGLHITVNYRRNATWYTVNHWVPEALSGLSDAEIEAKKEQGKTQEKDSVAYILLDTERMQGRVGGLTRAVIKSGGVYDLLTPLPFSQQLIVNELLSNSTTGTTVDIYYKEADSYRVIFDTDNTYIPRQQIPLEQDVKFEAITKEPTRKGYQFVGWQYLKKDAQPDQNGNYHEDDYIVVEKDSSDNYTLKISAELISKKAKLKETDGVLALYLYPKWEPDHTQVRVVLWTEDLTGADDVQATAAGGNTTYYDEKYRDYADEPQTHAPIPQHNNSNYSNVGSFTVDVVTDSSLVTNGGRDLTAAIQAEVTEHFKASARETDGVNVSQFYTQNSFEIMHETGGTMDYSTTTANADGKTTIYVYFTRNIYTLKFHYYGLVDGKTSIAVNTNGYSYGGTEKITDDNGELVFDRNPKGKIQGATSNGWWENQWWAVSGATMPVPQTITIKAKYGADLRAVWPAARAEECVTKDWYNPQVVSWATTAGKYRDEAIDPTSTHYYEATLMGLYATMDEEIIGDPEFPETTHHLVAYWSGQYKVSYYRYNHCFELPGLTLDPNVKTVTLDGQDRDNLSNVLYLVPADDPQITKFGFTDLMEVSYEDDKVTYDVKGGGYYAVRGYSTGGGIKYYAVGRQVETVSTNAIQQQNPSARAHMDRVNPNADHTTKYTSDKGRTWGENWVSVGTLDAPYDLYFYYDRERYTITYVAPSADRSDTVLGYITLPFGAYVTKEQYAFPLEHLDTNQQKIENGTAKYLWTYPNGAPVPVCPDRNPDGTAVWMFKGWGLGPAGVNMQWEMPDTYTPQAMAEQDFYIDSDLLLYAIWEAPTLKVTFHLNGGVVSDKASIEVLVPANTVYTTVGTIPRPVRNGYTLVGWYKSDADGTAGSDPFDFDSLIIEDQHVAAVWQSATAEKYSYDVYYVTPKLNDGDTGKGTVQIDPSGNIVETGGKTYYVLEKRTYPDQPYVAGTVLNLTASIQPGYTPKATNQTLEITAKDQTYHAVFFYDPQTAGSHTVRFVEAGTELSAAPVVIKEITAAADQTVVTPGTDAVNALTRMGYELVSKGSGGQYTAVEHYENLTWLDAEGKANPISTLAGDQIPDVVTYLVQPIVYTITYEIAAGSPAGADEVLAAVTAMENTPVEHAGNQNPTQYMVKDQFTLKNPGAVDGGDGKQYVFDYWTLGSSTAVVRPPEADGKYPQLKVEPGTTGNLTFVAHWKESDPAPGPDDPSAPKGNLKVSKTVSGTGAVAGQEFTFTVVLNDKTVNGVYGEMTFTDGTAVFSLMAGEEKIAMGLPAGTSYTVSERGSDDYTVTVNGAHAVTAEGVISADQTAVAAFNNHRDKPNPGPGGDDDKISVTVKKVWVLDDGGTAPDSVTVALMRNGKQDRTVELTADNGWTHTWSKLDSRYTWTVKELNVPEGFTASVAQAGTTFTITNDDVSGQPPVDPDKPVPPVDPDDPTPPDEPDKPAPTDEPDDPVPPIDPDTPDTPDVPDQPDNPDQPDDPNPPQPVEPTDDSPKTGDETDLSLWLALLVISGSGMVATAALSRRLGEEKRRSR